MSQFTENLRRSFQRTSDQLLNGLRAGEDLVISLDAEESLFLRFNANKIRQNTNNHQVAVSLKYQANGRTLVKSRTVAGDAERDGKALAALLEECRAEARHLPADPFQVPLANNGQSNQTHEGSLLGAKELIESVASVAKGSDLAGLYCGGPVVSANRNSKGQDHWFATTNFYLDYSLYNGPKAAKSLYADSRWDGAAWQRNFERTRAQLELLSKPVQNVKPGKYRTYLAPKAVSDMVSMCGWGALSANVWKQGRSPFQKLAEGAASFSPLFTVKENFGLGLSPRFNELGEVAPESIALIEKGKLQSFLVSSKTAKEFGLKSNAASEQESYRSLDVSPGSLDEKDALRELGTGLYLSNVHYLNWSDPLTARVTGMTRYACFWVEKGEIVGPIKDLRFDESLFEAFGSNLLALTNHAETDPSTSSYVARTLGGIKAPGALIEGFTFTL